MKIPGFVLKILYFADVYADPGYLNKPSKSRFYKQKTTLEAKKYFYLLHNHIWNLTKRTKVLCLSKRFDNQELWKDKSSGFCTEYKSSLFTQNNLIFNTNTKKGKATKTGKPTIEF